MDNVRNLLLFLLLSTCATAKSSLVSLEHAGYWALSIESDCSVVYSPVGGKTFRSTLSAKEVQKILKELETAGFFKLRSDYPADPASNDRPNFNPGPLDCPTAADINHTFSMAVRRKGSAFKVSVHWNGHVTPVHPDEVQRFHTMAGKVLNRFSAPLPDMGLRSLLIQPSRPAIRALPGPR